MKQIDNDTSTSNAPIEDFIEEETLKETWYRRFVVFFRQPEDYIDEDETPKKTWWKRWGF